MTIEYHVWVVRKKTTAFINTLNKCRASHNAKEFAAIYQNCNTLHFLCAIFLSLSLSHSVWAIEPRDLHKNDWRWYHNIWILIKINHLVWCEVSECASVCVCVCFAEIPFQFQMNFSGVTKCADECQLGKTLLKPSHVRISFTKNRLRIFDEIPFKQQNSETTSANTAKATKATDTTRNTKHEAKAQKKAAAAIQTSNSYKPWIYLLKFQGIKLSLIKLILIVWNIEAKIVAQNRIISKCQSFYLFWQYLLTLNEILINTQDSAIHWIFNLTITR